MFSLFVLILSFSRFVFGLLLPSLDSQNDPNIQTSTSTLNGGFASLPSLPSSQNLNDKRNLIRKDTKATFDCDPSLPFAYHPNIVSLASKINALHPDKCLHHRSAPKCTAVERFDGAVLEICGPEGRPCQEIAYILVQFAESECGKLEFEGIGGGKSRGVRGRWKGLGNGMEVVVRGSRQG